MRTLAELYQWAEHKPNLPKSLGVGVALIVTNSPKHLHTVLKRAHPYTAVLVYYEDGVISLDRRSDSDLLLVDYLNSVSERFIRGHVRILLQLQKHFIGIHEGMPLVVTKPGSRLMIDHLFQALDTNKSVEVNCDYVETFAATFAAFAELTSYDSALLVESPTVFGEAVKR